MQWGLMGANVGAFAQPENAVVLAQAAEAAGFDSLWTFDHVVVPRRIESTYPYAKSGKAPGLATAAMPDSMVWLAYVAAATSTITLGTGVMILPQRNPVVLAKQAATLDFMSGGRLRLGVGVGWLKEEFDALGVPFEHRGARAEEYIAAMRALWSSDSGSFGGEFVSFTDVQSLPAPPHGAVHIAIGGHSEAAARRAGRLGDGFLPAIDAESVRRFGMDGALDHFFELIELMRTTAREHGRNPDEIEVSLFGGLPPGPEVVERLEEAGVHRGCIALPTHDPARMEESLTTLAQQLAIR